MSSILILGNDKMDNNTGNTKKNYKVAVVTGSSSGIGFEISLLLARNDFYTYATMRNPDKSKKEGMVNVANRERLPLQVIPLDVVDNKSVKEAIGRITTEQGRIDVLVNNAGYLLLGPLEELSIEEFKEQFETNFFGAVRVTQAVLPIMRRHKEGVIINISSIAGRIGFPLSSAYVSSKFALEGLSESMAYEVEQFGIKVILIEPGVIKTNFPNNLKIGKRVDNSRSSSNNNNNSNTDSSSPYSELIRNRIAGFKPRFESGSSPIEVAKIILKCVTSETPQLRYLVGDDAFKLMDIRKNSSDKYFRKLVIDSVLQYHQQP
jgi:NAD(P)-dependent dehydrogenase (short-subunit alcohol dehydrogenase family)